MKEDERYLSAAATLGERVRRVLSRVPAQIAAEVTEIRLRTGKAPRADGVGQGALCG